MTLSSNEDQDRLDYLLKLLTVHPYLAIIRNPYTGTFLNAYTETPGTGEVSKVDRLGRGPSGDDGRLAIDDARARRPLDVNR